MSRRAREAQTLGSAQCAARSAQRGAALLLALVVVTVISTLAAQMVWQQWRSVQVETAERARAQAQWILAGATDWARLILREDARGSQIDHLGEPWALPLEEARLSTFLAGGREDLEANPALQAFVSGQITDAQSKFNLRNLVLDGPAGAAAQRGLLRLCESIGVGSAVGQQLIDGARRTWAAAKGEAQSGAAAAPVAPERLSDLRWWGIDRETLERLRPWVVVLPKPTPLNLNTASVEVIMASLEGVDLGAARRLAQARAQSPMRSLDQAVEVLRVSQENANLTALALQSSFFEVRGQLRLGDRWFAQQSLVERRQLDVVVVQRERGVGLQP